MKKGRNLISFLVSIVLMFSLIITTILILFNSSFLSKDFYYDILSDNRIPQKINESINDGMKYMLLKNNIPSNIIDDIVTVKEVEELKYNAVNEIISYMSGDVNEVSSIDSSVYANRVTEAINTYFHSNNIVETDSTVELITDIEQYAKDLIEFEIEPMNYQRLNEKGILDKVRKISVALNNDVLLFGVIGFDILLCMVLIYMWKRRKYRGNAWIGYSFVSSGILIFMVGFSGYLSKFYSDNMIASKGFKIEVAKIIEENLINISTYGVILFVIGLAFMSVYWYYIYKNSKKGRV